MDIIGKLPVELQSKIFSYGTVRHPLADIFDKHIRVEHVSEDVVDLVFIYSICHHIKVYLKEDVSKSQKFDKDVAWCIDTHKVWIPSERDRVPKMIMY